MSGSVQPIAQTAQPAPKQKRKRSPSVARPAFIIVQVLDDQGHPIEFNKKHLKVVAVERSAEKVMEAMEDGTHRNAFYLRVIVPAGTQQRRAAQATPTAA